MWVCLRRGWAHCWLIMIDNSKMFPRGFLLGFLRGLLWDFVRDFVPGSVLGFVLGCGLLGFLSWSLMASCLSDKDVSITLHLDIVAVWRQKNIMHCVNQMLHDVVVVYWWCVILYSDDVSHDIDVLNKMFKPIMLCTILICYKRYWYVK